MMFSSHYCSTFLSISYWFAAAIVGLILVQSADSNCRVLSVDEICYPQPLHVSFYLYTRNTSNRPFQINYNNIEEAPFLPSTPVKILIHGYTGWKDYSPNMELRPAYFKRSDYNLISIDWSELAREGCYIEATNNVKPVGQCAARMLEKIVEVRKDVRPEDVHVVGFSLGAHVAGFIGKSLEKFRAKRITGLDPALPLFDNIFNSYYSLKEEDAEFIDVIHTNAGMKGKPSRVGHVDFFANDGSIQPGCAKTNTSCHHVRSVEIFAESINTQVGFFGFECASFFDYMTECCTNLETKPIGWVLLGEYVNRSSRGEYYFNTKSKSPFAIGKGCTP